MRDGLRFCSVAAFRDVCHDMFVGGVKALAAQKGQREELRRNMSLVCAWTTWLPKKVEDMRAAHPLRA